MPITPTRSLLPKRSEISRRAGVALSVSSAPPRLTSKVSSWSALALTMRCMSAKVSIGCPSMLTITSPGLKPASAAAPSGTNSSTRGAVTCTPTNVKVSAKMTIASMKLAIGRRPRWPTAPASDLVWKAPSRSAGDHALQGRLGGNAGAVLVVEKLDVAAERDPGEAASGCRSGRRSRKSPCRSRWRRP